MTGGGWVLRLGVIMSASVVNYIEPGGARSVIGGQLDVISGGECDIESGGALKIAGVDATTRLSGLAALSTAELAVLDGATAGTPVASKAVVADVNLEVGGAGVIRYADVLIATAAVKTLNATPVQLVAAPTAGSFLELLAIYIFLEYATTAYDGIAAGEDLTVKYTDASGGIAATIEATGFLDATADALAIGRPAITGVRAVQDAALVLHMLTGEIATGDSPLKIRTVYREIRSAALQAIV